jgi:N-acetylglucosamine kinase-like BadF-type ATPase
VSEDRPALLALDGGGSKIDVALVDRSGDVLGAARGTRPVDGGPDMEPGEGRDLAGLGAVLESVCMDAGVDPRILPIADLGVYCLAGADLPIDDRRIARSLRDRGWTAEDILRNDTFAVLRAGSERWWGVAVVCGYGMNCSAAAPDGRTLRFPAVGNISGDWGGGRDVGGAALWHAVRSRDGRGGRTVLASLVPAHFGVKQPRQVMEAIYLGRIRQERLVELPPLVFRAAGEGDRVARGIVDRQADEVVAMAGAAIRRLRLTRLDVDVVLGGGIFRTEDRIFFDRIEDGVRAVAPDARIHVLAGPPVVGAALLGLDRLRADGNAGTRLRAVLTHERLTSDGVRRQAIVARGE